jgi:hypothetical protein
VQFFLRRHLILAALMAKDISNGIATAHHLGPSSGRRLADMAVFQAMGLRSQRGIGDSTDDPAHSRHAGLRPARILDRGGSVDRKGGCAMRAEMIAELGGSVIITAMTGLYTIGGLALACYFFLVLSSALGTIPLLFGFVNLPLFIIWSRETVHEITTRAASTSIELPWSAWGRADQDREWLRRDSNLQSSP